MGFVREREDDDGKIRYMAVYRDERGKVRSAGTFADPRKADKAWQRAEAALDLGEIGDPRRGRKTLLRLNC